MSKNVRELYYFERLICKLFHFKIRILLFRPYPLLVKKASLILTFQAYTDAFKGCRSVILASGTLSPTETLRTELGTTFQQVMEGYQIIPNEQIFAAVIPSVGLILFFTMFFF